MVAVTGSRGGEVVGRTRGEHDERRDGRTLAAAVGGRRGCPLSVIGWSGVQSYHWSRLGGGVGLSGLVYLVSCKCIVYSSKPHAAVNCHVKLYLNWIIIMDSKYF